MGSASLLQTVIDRITQPDLSRDRRHDFELLSTLVDEICKAPQPLDTAHQILTRLYVDYAKRAESVIAFRHYASFSLLLSRSLSSLSSSHENKTLDQLPSDDALPYTIFLIDTDAWLGHLQILGSFLQLCSPLQKKSLQVISFSGKAGSKFSRLMAQQGVNYNHIKKAPFDQRLSALEKHVATLSEKGYAVRLVWITWPPLLFIGGLRRLAPVQVAWAMKYPFQLGLHYDEILYAYGFNKYADQKLYLHDSFTPVRLLPFSLTTEILQASDQSIPEAATNQAIATIRDWKQTPDRIAILSVARPEKMSNADFLKRLSALLSANPNAHFFWCGRKGSADTELFQRKLQQNQLHAKSSLLGWVQPWPVIKSCDYFLDTYPFGSGITLAQALRLDKPVIIHASNHSDKIDPEKMLVEEPNFNNLLDRGSDNVIMQFDDKSAPKLDPDREMIFAQSEKAQTSGYRGALDPFAPDQAITKLLSMRLLGYMEKA